MSLQEAGGAWGKQVLLSWWRLSSAFWGPGGSLEERFCRMGRSLPPPDVKPSSGGRRNVNDRRSSLGNLPTVFPPLADCILIKK